MKKIAILLVFMLFLSTACSLRNSVKLNVNQQLYDEQKKEEEKRNELDSFRNQVIEKYRNERDVLGTDKFIEDVYKQYPDDEVISSIYNYNNAVFCYEVSKDGIVSEQEWISKAKAYAASISPTYSGAFSEEIIPYVSDLLGDEWKEIREKTLQQEEMFNNLSLADKKEIYNFIDNRYQYYDEKEGKPTGDKYSEIIWSEASEKYGLEEYYISEIWIDIDVIKSVGMDNEEKTQIVCDAILDYEGQDSIIAVSEDVLNRFLRAISEDNKGTQEELINSFKIGFVPVNTPVNVVEKKFAVAKVKILSGIYKDNEVWILIECLHEK